MINTENYNRDNYIFASAYIGCIEKYLLTQEKAVKMLESLAFDDALRILYDLGYDDGSGENRFSDFEDLLNHELEKVYETILSLVPQEKCFSVFLYPNDYQNIKTLLKAEFLEIKADGFLINTGSIPTERLALLVHKRNYADMRPAMAKGIQEAIEAFGSTRDPQTVDLILDQACYTDINIETSGLKNTFIKGYVALKIDTINLKSFLRVKQMNKPWDFFLKVFIGGGNISEKIFHDNYNVSLDNFSEKLGAFEVGAALQQSLVFLKESGRFTVLERLCDDLLLKYLRKAKYVSYGIEPVFAYMAAKENEIRTARIILAGKLANLPDDQIKERVRETYV